MLKTLVACDTCEGTPARTVRVKIGTRTVERDLCRDHERSEFQGWRRAKRGKPKQ